jgi:hypothetical protein
VLAENRDAHCPEDSFGGEPDQFGARIRHADGREHLQHRAMHLFDIGLTERAIESAFEARAHRAGFGRFARRLAGGPAAALLAQGVLVHRLTPRLRRKHKRERTKARSGTPA